MVPRVRHLSSPPAGRRRPWKEEEAEEDEEDEDDEELEDAGGSPRLCAKEGAL